MTDLITEARELCEKWSLSDYAVFECEDCIANMVIYKVVELCDALEKAGAQMPRWIPVSERLPENGRYLTCSVWCGKQMINIDSFSTDRSKVDDYDMRGLGAGFYNYHSESGYFPVDDITHWMPLPAAPEKEVEK